VRQADGGVAQVGLAADKTTFAALVDSVRRETAERSVTA
jgi:hypothetical protein